MFSSLRSGLSEILKETSSELQSTYNDLKLLGDSNTSTTSTRKSNQDGTNSNQSERLMASLSNIIPTLQESSSSSSSNENQHATHKCSEEQMELLTESIPMALPHMVERTQSSSSHSPLSEDQWKCAEELLSLPCMAHFSEKRRLMVPSTCSDELFFATYFAAAERCLQSPHEDFLQYIQPFLEKNELLHQKKASNKSHHKQDDIELTNLNDTLMNWRDEALCLNQMLKSSSHAPKAPSQAKAKALAHKIQTNKTSLSHIMAQLQENSQSDPSLLNNCMSVNGFLEKALKRYAASCHNKDQTSSPANTAPSNSTTNTTRDSSSSSLEKPASSDAQEEHPATTEENASVEDEDDTERAMPWEDEED